MYIDKEVKPPDVGSTVDIQTLYEDTFPGNSAIDSYFDGYEVATGDLDIELSDCRIQPNKNVKPWRELNGFEPVLKTAMPEKRQNGLMESLLALKKRNMAAPNLQDSVNEFEIIEKTITKSTQVFLDPALIDNSQMNTIQGAQRWWTKQSYTAQRQMIASTKFLNEIDVCTYNFMIKNDVKPKMDLSPQTEYSSLQTVIYPDKEVNAIFGPIMKEINERIRLALRPHVIYNTRMTADELNNSVEFLNPYEEYDNYEIDFSKFDKSKTSLHIKTVIEFYKLFGLDEMLSYLWEKSQTQTVAKDRLNGVIAFLLHQQKSGNCDTYGSNTWSAALALLETMPLEKARFMIFGGDDSLILFPKATLVRDPCRRLASLWNFDCKLFQFKINMFCGKFFIKVGDKFKFAPDPMKLITKLGRKDIKDETILSEIFVSLNDNYRSYSDYRVLEALAGAVMERYKTPYCALGALISLRKYISNFDLFKTLFNYKGKFKNVKVRKDYEW